MVVLWMYPPSLTHIYFHSFSPSPAAYSFEETLNTLKYANRAKNIKIKVTRNVLNVNYHISEYVNLIQKLKEEISNLKSQILKPSGEEVLKEWKVEAVGDNKREESQTNRTEKTVLDGLRQGE